MAQECLSLIRVESDLYFDAFLPLKDFICAGLTLLVRYRDKTQQLKGLTSGYVGRKNGNYLGRVIASFH